MFHKKARPGLLTRATKRRSVWLLFGSILIIAGMATATTLLFTQTFPSVAQAGLTEGCSTLVADNLIAATPVSVNFDCGGPAAFTTVNTGPYTPTYTLPTGATALSVVTASTASPGTQCQGQAGVVALTSGSAVSTLTANHGYDYCLSVSGTSVTTFSVTWMQ